MQTATHDKKKVERARFRLAENVRYQHRDKDGNVKPLFAVNAIGKAILSIFRDGYSPYNADGTQKTGLRAHLALYGLRIPMLTGAWVGEMEISNLITTAGKAGVASRINGAGSEAAFTYIEVGIGTTAAAIGDTALESAITDSGLARASATASRVTTDTTNDTAQLVVTFTVSGTKAVTESGVFNASSAGVLLCRQTFSAINVVSGDSLQITWKIDVD